MTQAIRPLRYDPVAVALHWVIALCILLMIPMGMVMEDLPIEMRFGAFTLHKSIGITVLGLSLFRLIWRLLNPPPALVEGMKPYEKLLAHLAHWGLYFLIIAMPLSGWLMVSALRKYPTDFFWLGEVPFLPMPEGIDPKATKEMLEEVHEILANGALILIALHVAAALKHHLVYKDTTLTRMLPLWMGGKPRA